MTRPKHRSEREQAIIENCPRWLYEGGDAAAVVNLAVEIRRQGRAKRARKTQVYFFETRRKAEAIELLAEGLTLMEDDDAYPEIDWSRVLQREILDKIYYDEGGQAAEECVEAAVMAANAATRIPRYELTGPFPEVAAAMIFLGGLERERNQAVKQLGEALEEVLGRESKRRYSTAEAAKRLDMAQRALEAAEAYQDELDLYASMKRPGQRGGED